MKPSIYSQFRPKWKAENRPLSHGEKKHLWKIEQEKSREASSGTPKSSVNIGTWHSPIRLNDAS